MDLCQYHEKQVEDKLKAGGHSGDALVALQSDVRSVVLAQAGQVSRSKVLQCLAAKDGTKEACLICQVGDPSWVGHASEDVLEYHKVEQPMSGSAVRA